MIDPNISKSEPPFPVGAQVWLRRAQRGASGKIVKVVRGKLGMRCQGAAAVG